MSLPIAMMTKESVNRAYETTLAEGIRFERRVFHAMFATADQKEGVGGAWTSGSPASRMADMPGVASRRRAQSRDPRARGRGGDWPSVLSERKG